MRRPTLSVKRAFIIIVAGILAVGGAWCGHGLLRKHPAHLRILQPNIVDFGVVNEDDVVERSF